MRRLLGLAAVVMLAAVLPTGLVGARGTRPPVAGLAVTAGGAGGGVAGGTPGQAAAPVAVRPGGASEGGPGGADSDFRTILLAGGRLYVLHQPPARVAAAAAPLVIVLHGLYNTWQAGERSGGWARYADAHGFIVAYGIGVDASWNAGSCCGHARGLGIDDVDYLVSVVGDMAGRYPIDRDRVYLVGFSAGDMMAMRAACDRPDVFAAAGGSSGALVAPCAGTGGQVRILHLHGRYDTVVPYRGGYSTYTDTRFGSVAALRRTIEAGSPGARVTVTTLACWHAWPRRDNACRVDGTDLIWRWVSRFHLPAPAGPRSRPLR